MAKKTNSGKKQKKEPLMNSAMTIFIAGCLAELYLLLLRNYTVSGSLDEYVRVFELLKPLTWVSLAVLAVGLVVWLVFRKKQKGLCLTGKILFGVGAFSALTHWTMQLSYPNAVTILCVMVPAAILLGILWVLYDRECAWALTILGASVLVIWFCRRELDNQMWGRWVFIAACAYLAVLVLVILLSRRLDRTEGMLGQIRLTPAKMDYLPVYTACGLSVVGVGVALFSAAIAYYALWVLAVVMFALVVYYTVRQL